MSGEAIGSVVGVGFLLAAGGAMAAALLVGGAAAAALYVGNQAVNGTSRLVLSGIDKRRQKMLEKMSKEIETMEFDSSFSAENMACEMKKLYQSRAAAVKNLENIFENDQKEGALERFLEEMYKQNALFVGEISHQKEALISKYEEKIAIELNSLVKAIKENQNQIEVKLEQIQTEFQKHEDETKKEAWKVYTIANVLLEQLLEGYTEVEDICTAEIKSIRENLIFSKEQLEGAACRSYEHIIALCGELPTKIIECMNMCDKYRIGKYVYLDAADKMLQEIQKFLETQRVVEYKKESGNFSDEEEIDICEINKFMNGKYEEILKTVNRYYSQLEEKSNISEKELVDIYHEISELYTYTIREVANGMERIRNYHMRNDMAVEVIEDLTEQGYSLKEQHTDTEEGTVSIELINDETGNMVSVLISESAYLNYTGQIELVNNIKIDHVSDQLLTDETEEERLDIRQKVMDSINSSKKLEKEYGSLRCNIACKVDSYMKNPS